MGKIYPQPVDEVAPMCGCDCENPVIWNKYKNQWNRYINGHNKRGCVPWNKGIRWHKGVKKVKKMEGKRNIDYVRCEICGNEYRMLPKHLRVEHNLSKEEYEEQYNVPTICEKTLEKMVAVGVEHHIKYPNMAREVAINTQKKYRGLSSKTMKATNERRMKEDLEGFKEQCSKAGKRTHELHPNLASESGKRCHLIHPDLRWELMKSHEEWKRNKKEVYVWKSVMFLSKLEMEVAKKILTEPIKGVNCHVKVNGKIIDFFPQIGDKTYVGCFVEYHPWDFKGRSVEEYEQERKIAVDESEYEGIPLVVIVDIKEVK